MTRDERDRTANGGNAAREAFHSPDTDPKYHAWFAPPNFLAFRQVNVLPGGDYLSPTVLRRYSMVLDESGLPAEAEALRRALTWFLAAYEPPDRRRAVLVPLRRVDAVSRFDVGPGAA